MPIGSGGTFAPTGKDRVKISGVEAGDPASADVSFCHPYGATGLDCNSGHHLYWSIVCTRSSPRVNGEAVAEVDDANDLHECQDGR
jgi:hypothetical protein